MILRENKIILFFYNKLNRFTKKVDGKGNSFNISNAILKKTSIQIIGNNNRIEIEEGNRLLYSSIVIKGDNHSLVIKKDCNIKNTVFWIEDEECSILVGKGTTIEGAHIAVTEPNSNIDIGEDCMLSSDIDIRNGDSHSIIDAETGRRINFAKDIKVGHHVWISKGVQILKGVEIGSHSIIGTKAMVTKNVPRNSVATGCPAVIVKSKVTWDRKRIYNE